MNHAPAHAPAPRPGLTLAEPEQTASTAIPDHHDSSREPSPSDETSGQRTPPASSVQSPDRWTQLFFWVRQTLRKRPKPAGEEEEALLEPRSSDEDLSRTSSMEPTQIPLLPMRRIYTDPYPQVTRRQNCEYYRSTSALVNRGENGFADERSN